MKSKSHSKKAKSISRKAPAPSSGSKSSKISEFQENQRRLADMKEETLEEKFQKVISQISIIDKERHLNLDNLKGISATSNLLFNYQNLNQFGT